ncbi:MAG: hypothetical protein WCA32_10585 [Chromatiaceae bacterium]|jgi:hypothetical protein
MKRKIDSPLERHIFSHRFGTVEPVFGNIISMLGTERFRLS